jgi:hypothetical protein
MSNRRALFPLLSILNLASPSQGAAQCCRLDRFQYTLPLHMARALPVAGPEAAPANPARLAEAEHWYSQFGTATAGNVSMTHTGAGMALPGGLSLGLAGLGVAGSAAGTNAKFLEQRAALQAAFKVPGMAPGAALYLGYALAWHGVNAWSIYKETAFTHDLGLVWRPAPLGRGWRADLGLALRDLVPMDAEIPDSVGGYHRYRLYGPKADAIASLASPSGLFSGWISGVAGPRFDWKEHYGPYQSTGSGMGSEDFEMHFHRYGVSFRPAKALAIRFEHIGFSVWQAGATLGAVSLLRWRLEADAAISKGDYYAYTRPSGSGYTFAWALRSGW